MANKILISEGKLKSFTNINKNVDIDVIRAEISVTQDIHLQVILGTKFYNELLDKITLTGNTLTEDEKTLIDDYVAPYLIQKSYAELIPHLWARSMNRGIVVGDMESATSSDVDTMKYLRNLQVQRSDFYAQRLVDYLCTNNSLYPTYNSQTTNDGLTPEKPHYNSSIVLNHATRKGYPINSRLPSYSENEKLGYK